MNTSKNKAPLISSGVCRCCRAVKKLRLLTHQYVWMENEENYSDMLLDCFGLILSHLDGEQLDNGVCATCVVRIRDACSFKKLVLQSEEIFLKECIKVTDASTVTVKSEPEDMSDGDEAENIDNDEGLESVPDINLVKQPIKDEILKEDGNSQEETKDFKMKVNRSRTDGLLSRKRLLKKRVSSTSSNDVRRKLCVKGKLGRNKGALSIIRKPVAHDEEHMMETNLINLVENSYVCPFSNRFSCYFCFYCYRTFTMCDELRRHTSEHDPKKYKELFKKRNHPKVDITRIDCRLCDEKIDDLETFRLHLTGVHNKRYYDIKYAFLAFRLTDANLVCIECGLNFPFFDKLLNHMVVHYSRFTCDVCGKAFLDEINLKTHLQSHSVKKYVCEVCSKEFCTEQAKEQHHNTAHSKDPSISCTKCDDLFFSYSLRQVHMEMAHGEAARFECSVCQKVYHRKRSLTEHFRRVHLKVKRHQCEFCSERFFTPALLRDHLTTHTGEKNYSCDYCDKCYPRLKTLQQHLRIHTNDRRYKCQICNSAFVQNVSLKCHMKSHHPDFVDS